MKCSYCDSVIPKMPEDGHCPNCGAVLGYERVDRSSIIYPNVPKGTFGMIEGKLKKWYDHIEVGENSITLYKSDLKEWTVKTVLFSELYDVVFVPFDGLRGGSLCLRSEQEREKVLPPNFSFNLSADKLAVLMSRENIAEYKKVYEFLRQCVLLNRGARRPAVEAANSPYGSHEGATGFVEVWENCVHFHSRYFDTVRTVFFESLAEVSFSKAGSNADGVLSVRPDNQAKDLPMPVNKAKKDDLSIVFTQYDNEIMQKVFLFLSNQIESRKS